jgi:hypothetical protein
MDKKPIHVKQKNFDIGTRKGGGLVEMKDATGTVVMTFWVTTTNDELRDQGEGSMLTHVAAVDVDNNILGESHVPGVFAFGSPDDLCVVEPIDAIAGYDATFRVIRRK